MEAQNSREAIAASVLADVREALPPDMIAQLTLDSSLADLGLDSIATMGVVNRIESRFGFRIREEYLYDIETCADLVDCIAKHATPAGAKPAPAANVVTPGNPPPRAAAPTPPPATNSAAEIPVEAFDVAKFPECVEFDARAAQIRAAGLQIPFFRVNERVQHRVATIDGRDVVSYTSFDYLGLSEHPEVMAAAKRAIDEFGCSSSASRLVGGNVRPLEDLDREIADFMGVEAATVFPSGYGTNASVFGLLFGENDLILYDELAHNSIVSGATLSKAARRPFAHNDADALDALLRDLRPRYRRVVVALEGVYSMDGDFPNLPNFVEVKQRHKALLYIDEAHSAGVLGKTGRGICEHFGVSPAAGDLWMGTISKAFASGGGYLAGREPLIRYLKFNTPSFVFATACSPANAAASLTAIRVLRQHPEIVHRLQDRSRLFLSLAKAAKLDTGNSADTPIIPIILGSSARSLMVSQLLLEHGVNAQPILYPAVRESAARVRFFITADHTEEQIRQTVQVLAECVAATAK